MVLKSLCSTTFSDNNTQLRRVIKSAMLLAATLLATSFHATAQSLDVPPTPPKALSLNFYLNAGGELYWQRAMDDIGVSGYEITHNGVSLGIFDALSLYDPSLDENSRHHFSVTAVDTAGQRSTSVTLLHGDDIAPSPDVPASPEGLTSTVYSETSSELFWARVPGVALIYDITRNGGRVATVDGTSYYDSHLSAGSDYLYTVVAIDNQGNRSAPAEVTLRTPGTNNLPVDPDTSAEPPPAPKQLTATAYSATSGELFWARADTAGIRYQIFRDESELATLGGTSYYVDTLESGREYLFSVFALDSRGQRSAASTVLLRTPGEFSEPPDLSTPDDTTPLFPETSQTPAPRNITLSVYSATTAELNWTRPEYGDGIETNDILRDGELLETIPGGGNSYVDSKRAPGQGYRYEIVANNKFGRASSVFIDVGIPAGGPVGSGVPADQSSLPSDIAIALDKTLELLSASPFKKIAATIFRLDNPLAVGLTLINSEPDPLVSGSLRLEYACPQSGSWFVTAWNDEEDHRDIRAVACSIGPITLTGQGQLRRGLAGDGIADRRFVLFNRVNLLDDRDNSKIEVDYLYSGYDAGKTSGFVVSNQMAMTRTDGNYQVDAFRIVESNGLPGAINLSAENVTGALAGAARIRARETLLVGANGYPSSGAVAIAQFGANNKSYDIAAGNGNLETFTFTATIAGVTTTYDIFWSDKRNIGGLNPSGVDVGF